MTCRNRQRGRRLLVIGSLYLVANIGFSFFFITLATILLGRGVPLGTVALVHLAGAVYFARFLAAPVVDRYGCGWFSARLGHYRGWLVATQLGLLGTLLGLAPLDPVRQLPGVFLLMALVVALSLCHDTALGGLAVRLLPPAERGLGNGIQMASASASMLIGSGGALLLYARVGWTGTLLALASLFVVPLAVLAGLREPPPDPGGQRARMPWRELMAFLRRPRMAAWTLLVIPAFALGNWLAIGPQPAMLIASGWPLEGIALAQSSAQLAQVAAALLAGAAITRYGRVRSAVVIGWLAVATTVALLPLAGGSADPLPTTAVLVVGGVVYSAKLTWISTVTMDFARPSSAATDYAVPMSIEGIVLTVIMSAGLQLAALVGFPALIATAALLSIAGAVAVPLWLRRPKSATSGPQAAPAKLVSKEGRP